MSSECQGCGAWVSDDWCRVLLPEGKDDPDACPECATHNQVGRVAAGLERRSVAVWGASDD